MSSDDFEQRNQQNIAHMSADKSIAELTYQWFLACSRYEYSYHFTWLGRPIIQFPSDVIALQEIIWRVRPQVIVETGIARGGSLIFSASILELLGENGEVIGIDREIREGNRVEIEKHPLSKRITMLEGSSTDQKILAKVTQRIAGRSPVIIILDSNHTHAHVLEELKLYSPLVPKDSYLVVFDTIIEHMPPEFSANRNWGKGNSPMTAVRAFLSENDRFEVDQSIEKKLLITTAPSGYLRCIKE